MKQCIFFILLNFAITLPIYAPVYLGEQFTICIIHFCHILNAVIVLY